VTSCWFILLSSARRIRSDRPAGRGARTGPRGGSRRGAAPKPNSCANASSSDCSRTGFVKTASMIAEVPCAIPGRPADDAITIFVSARPGVPRIRSANASPQRPGITWSTITRSNGSPRRNAWSNAFIAANPSLRMLLGYRTRRVASPECAGSFRHRRQSEHEDRTVCPARCGVGWSD
jgi:hypothetical protein